MKEIKIYENGKLRYTRKTKETIKQCVEATNEIIKRMTSTGHVWTFEIHTKKKTYRYSQLTLNM